MYLLKFLLCIQCVLRRSTTSEVISFRLGTSSYEPGLSGHFRKSPGSCTKLLIRSNESIQHLLIRLNESIQHLLLRSNESIQHF